tara:strand:+ start:419 stop:1558 length:1140 start_codon:yes stop_codon:yes gene_type:complete
MSEKKFYTKILLAIMILISSCEVEEEQDYKTLKIYRNTYSKIIVDSTNVFRNSKNNDQLNVEIRYQARASNSDYDSIKWIFPGGIPEKLNNEMEATVVYDKYGAYDAKMVLIKYDTLNYNRVQMIIDSVPLNEEIKIKYKETNWSSYDSYSTPNIWTSIPNTDIIVGRINDIYTDQISIKSNFTGFDEEQLRISFDYKVTLENPMQTDDLTNNQKKMELKIDDFNRFTINKTNDDKYYSAYINVYNKSDFELKFNLFPPLTQTIWELDNSGSVTPFYEYKINEDQSYLINYINQVNTSSATIKYNDFIYGTSDMVNLKLGDTTKIIMPSGQSKIQVTMKDQFPYSYKVYEEDSRVTATSLNFNEYYFRIYIKNLIIEVF